MFEWFFPRHSKRQIERDEIRASAENEVQELRTKSAALDKTIEAVLRQHVERKARSQ